jgi:hypothetical protein
MLFEKYTLEEEEKEVEGKKTLKNAESVDSIHMDENEDSEKRKADA